MQSIYHLQTQNQLLFFGQRILFFRQQSVLGQRSGAICIFLQRMLGFDRISQIESGFVALQRLVHSTCPRPFGCVLP